MTEVLARLSFGVMVLVFCLVLIVCLVIANSDPEVVNRVVSILHGLGL